MRGPCGASLPLKPDVGQEVAESGPVGLGGRRGPQQRVLGCELERGAVMDGDRELDQEAAACRALQLSGRLAPPPIVMAWLVSGRTGQGWLA